MTKENMRSGSRTARDAVSANVRASRSVTVIRELQRKSHGIRGWQRKSHGYSWVFITRKVHSILQRGAATTGG